MYINIEMLCFKMLERDPEFNLQISFCEQGILQELRSFICPIGGLL